MLPSILACPLPMSRWPLPPLTHCSFGIVSSSHPGSNHSGSALRLSHRPVLASELAGPSTSFLRKYLRVVRAAANLMMTTKTFGGTEPAGGMPWSEHSIAAKIAIAPQASSYPATAQVSFPRSTREGRGGGR